MSNNPDDEDGLFDEEDDDDDDDDSSDDEIAATGTKKPKKITKKRKADDSEEKKKKPKSSKPSWIDDAAEESGDEGGGDDDDDDDDDDENNDYVKDDFVVDEADVEEETKKKRSGELEDSDEDDNDSDDDDDDKQSSNKKLKRKKFKKVRETDMLTEEDLMLIREARGEKEPEDTTEQEKKGKIVAKNAAELHKGLFYDDSGDEGGEATAPTKARRPMEERPFDEEGMDDFIDDDIGIVAQARRDEYLEEGRGGVSEAQLNEASEIFGTEYLDFMATDDGGEQDEQDLFGQKYKERGVGVDLGVDSEEESSDEDDDDDELFGDDDGDGVQAHQKSEALKLKRQKKELARQERRQQKEQKRNEARKIQLRRAFEPVQLVENFCTDRDDEIRRLDAPERLFDWKTPFHGSSGEEITEEEEEEALWIMGRIPEIAAEYIPTSHANLEEIEKREKSVVNSIVHALRFLHNEKLEPAFIKRYRKDVITSQAVRKNIYNIMDEDAGWDTMVSARDKVGDVLSSITKDVQKDEATGAEAESVLQLEQNLAVAHEKLEESAKQEAEIKEEIEGVGPIDEKGDDDDDDDDDELFGDDDDDDDVSTAKRPVVSPYELSGIVINEFVCRAKMPRKRRNRVWRNTWLLSKHCFKIVLRRLQHWKHSSRMPKPRARNLSRTKGRHAVFSKRFAAKIFGIRKTLPIITLYLRMCDTFWMLAPT
jgi:hypothetical protein